MKKKISTIFAFLMIVVLVAGCAAPATPQAAEATQPPAATDVPAKSDVTLTYLVSQGWAPMPKWRLQNSSPKKPASPLTTR